MALRCYFTLEQAAVDAKTREGKGNEKPTRAESRSWEITEVNVSQGSKQEVVNVREESSGKQQVRRGHERSWAGGR